MSAASAPPNPQFSVLSADLIKSLNTLIDRALEEDVAGGDVTTQSTVPADSQATGLFLAKEDGVLSGLAVGTHVFHRIDANIKVEWTAHDGQPITKGTYFGTAKGSSRSLLVAERLVLNLMQRMSGIASATNTYVRTMNSSHTRLLDTRKTAPGLRLLDKLAVLHGGGVNHRIGLYDMVLIKDNHIEAAGGVNKAVHAARAFLSQELAAGRGKQPNGNLIEVEVEARTLDEVREVIACDKLVDRVLLDNMVKLGADKSVDTSMLEQALALFKASNSSHKILTEASGNVNLHTIAAIGETGVDFVSVGALTHSVTALDISMKIKLEK